jgi:hypothetical protein
VKSSNISAVGYDEATQTLGVKFVGGGEHHYNNVTPELHKALVSAKSVGGHFHKHVRSRFKSTRVS